VKNLSYIHYIKFNHSLYNIYNVFRYSGDTKNLIPKTEIIFSKLLKIAKTAQKTISGHCAQLGGGIPAPPGTPLVKCPTHTTQPELYYKGSSNAVVISDVPTHTHAKNITHTQHNIHDVMNVYNLKLFEPSLLYEVVTVLHQIDNIQSFHTPFLAD
jgi:hypothetical protein